MDESAIRIALLDPGKAVNLSRGEVLSPKTVDPIRRKPYQAGLYCERIFGSFEPGVCRCGTYHKGYRENPVRCAKCNVLVQHPLLDGQRFGHITLALPVVHIWFRSIIAILLALPPKKLSEVIDYKAYIVLNPGESDFEKFDFIPETEYLNEVAGLHRGLVAMTGRAAVCKLRSELNLNRLFEELKAEEASWRVNRRLAIVKKLLSSGAKPEWMVLTVLRVMPASI